MPAPDIFASCPGDGRVLSYYAGVFNSVYVMLSPFIKPTRISSDRFAADTYPGKQELNAGAERVSWELVRQEAGIPTISGLDIALRTSIAGLRQEVSNAGCAKRLRNTLDKLGLVQPVEGEHPALLVDAVLGLFHDLGHRWVWIGDEFCSQRKLYWIDALLQGDATEISGHCNVFTADKSLLWTVHWDCHFTFLCGDRAVLEGARVAESLEGFFCGPESEVYWSVRG